MVAALCGWHEHHETTRKEVERLSQTRAALVLAAPSLVETFAVLTRLPILHRLSPEDAWTLLEGNWGEVALIALTASEY